MLQILGVMHRYKICNWKVKNYDARVRCKLTLKTLGILYLYAEMFMKVL